MTKQAESMQLLVDIGNSRIKWSTPQQLLNGQSRGGACQDLSRILQEQWSRMPRPVKVWLASVAKEEVTSRLVEWTAHHWKLSPVRVKSAPALLGVVNGYKDPAQLGVDRWLALLGARAVCPAPCLVVDCGTATTVDALDGQGRHLGGLILPGLRSMRETLAKHTAIQPFGTTREYEYFARDTAGGIASAAVLATSCVIGQSAMRLRSRMGSEVGCLLTGGAAAELNGSLELDVRHEPNLVLNGLALVAAQSTDP